MKDPKYMTGREIEEEIIRLISLLEEKAEAGDKEAMRTLIGLRAGDPEEFEKWTKRFEA